MANKKQNPFDMFGGLTTKKAKIEALGGQEIEYRELTTGEDDAFRLHALTGVGEDNKPELDMEKWADVKYMKVSAGLVYPKMSVEELKALPKSAAEAIDEILNLIYPAGEDIEGN